MVEGKRQLGSTVFLKKEEKTKTQTHTSLLAELAEVQRKGGGASTQPAFFPHHWHRTPVSPAVVDHVPIMVGSKGSVFQWTMYKWRAAREPVD